MGKEIVSEYFVRLGMSDRMRRQVEDWRAENREEGGRVMSFSEALRQLVDKGLSVGKD